MWRWLPLALGIAACSSEAVERPPRPPVDWQSLVPKANAAGPTADVLTRERAVGDAYMAALTAPGFADLTKLLSDVAHFSYAGYQDEYGREGVVKAHEALFGGFGPREFVSGRAFVSDGAQAREWVLRATHRKTGKPVVIKGITMLTTNYDDSIADVRVYFDQALVDAQVGNGPPGLVPPPLPAAPTALQEFRQLGSEAEKSNLAAVSASVDAFDGSAMAPDVELHALERAEPLRGGDARSHDSTLHRAIKEFDSTVDNAYPVGPFVIAEYHIVGEQKEPIAWVPVQKEPVLKMFVVDVDEMKDGKIARIWRYDNPAQIIDEPTAP